MIVREPESNYIPAPQGVHRAVCVDVVDMGSVETQWGAKPMLRIHWEIEETMEDGKRFVVVQRYNASLHQKSNLRKDLEVWRGRPFTSEELKGFDLEKVVGIPCNLQVMHNAKGDRIYANVAGIMPPRGDDCIEPSGTYTRVKDRDDQPTHGADSYDAGPEDGGPEDDFDDIPF